jgi:MFS family permease
MSDPQLIAKIGETVQAAMATAVRQSTSMLGVFGLGTLGGRLLSGYLVDRFFAPYIAVVFFLLGAVGILITSGAGGAVPTFGIVLLGIAAGTEIDMLG